jgi:hypothetical protein
LIKGPHTSVVSTATIGVIAADIDVLSLDTLPRLLAMPSQLSKWEFLAGLDDKDDCSSSSALSSEISRSRASLTALRLWLIELSFSTSSSSLWMALSLRSRKAFCAFLF